MIFKKMKAIRFEGPLYLHQDPNGMHYLVGNILFNNFSQLIAY